MDKIVNKQRFLGIDLCRGIAAFAVILVHSGDETWGIPVSDRALQFRFLFYFAVPFFLATSFFFLTRNLSKNINLDFLVVKLQRIFIPYIFWSIFYLFLRTLFFFFTNQTDRLNQLAQDPLSIIFFGGASYHLYFLPLLFSGTLLLILFRKIIKQQNATQLMLIIFIISIILNEVIGLSGNLFKLNPNIAFSGLLNLLNTNVIYYPVVRFLLVQLAWILNCLPYFCMAVILNHLLLKIKLSVFKNGGVFLLFASIFIYVNFIGETFILNELSKIIIAFSLLLVGICLSTHFKESSIIENLGNCSFGIYLIHPIVKKIIGIILTFAVPQVTSQITVVSMLCLSIPSFLTSWLLVSQLLKNKQLAKYMFGMRINF
ncbi:MAG: acyltransferase [Nodularia sp. (in: Bacteria)]|nr:MAG: acyltransferase [Nodularia sp. (in: cyanobacteria)]